MKREQAPLILGIESSCDDTSAAVIRGPHVLSNVVANQALHAEVGGVVPEWASRAHLSKIQPVVEAALQKANVAKSELDAVAYTLGPGLQGSLHVGTSFAKAMAWSLDIPSIPVHHMRAHILAHVLEPGDAPRFPFLCLTVSGGHTQLVRVDAANDMSVLGQTLDDAAGEAFDKVAKLIGLPYPGGPVVDQLASQGRPDAFAFSRPKMPGYDWSFSGLKTQVLHFLQREQAKDSSFVSSRKEDICASVQEAILDMLMDPLVRAARDTGIQEGGHCRRSQRQLRFAGPFERGRGSTRLAHPHSPNGLLHGQCRHDCGGGVVGSFWNNAKVPWTRRHLPDCLNSRVWHSEGQGKLCFCAPRVFRLTHLKPRFRMDVFHAFFCHGSSC